jgi:hypothetical protein
MSMLDEDGLGVSVIREARYSGGTEELIDDVWFSCTQAGARVHEPAAGFGSHDAAASAERWTALPAPARPRRSAT